MAWYGIIEFGLAACELNIQAAGGIADVVFLRGGEVMTKAVEVMKRCR